MYEEFMEEDIHQQHNESRVFKVLSTEKVYDLMNERIMSVKEVAQLPSNMIRNLLHKFKWDSDKLLEMIFEDENLARETWEKVPRNIRTSMDCEICYDTMQDATKIKIFDCNHRSCTDCLQAYLVTQISDGGLLNSIRCPGFQCKYELTDDLVLQLLADDEMKINKYKQIITNSFVQNNNMLKWCPSANCNNAIQIQTGYLLNLTESVRCACGSYFCFLCKSESHDPLSCETFKKWLEESFTSVADLQSEEWIAKNTKACPKCTVKIQKNGGCDHMSCRSCNYEFYWTCLCRYRSHSCNPQQLQKSEKNSAKRYSIYLKKFEFMNNAYKLDVRHYKKMMNYKQEIELRQQWVKVDFVANAIEMLLQCRRTIMYSYVFLYYMTTIGNEIYLLETMVENFYNSIESLAHLIENNITTEVTWESVYAIKADIITNTSNCTTRRRRLLDYINEGTEEKWWREFPIPAEELLGEALPDDDLILFN